MGGDAGPGMVVGGSALARERHPNLRFLLFGDEAKITPLLSRYRALRGVVEVHHTDLRLSRHVVHRRSDSCKNTLP